eukprot:Gb_02664 [translate_table: standard]
MSALPSAERTRLLPFSEAKSSVELALRIV